MVPTYLPIPDVDRAPPVVAELRAAFDNRLEELYAQAVRLMEGALDAHVRMVHVPFAFEGYMVEAMYDREQDLFTQLVARPLMDTENARPAFTISIFLVEDLRSGPPGLY